MVFKPIVLLQAIKEVDLICDHADDIEVLAEPHHDLNCKTQEVSPFLKHMTVHVLMPTPVPCHDAPQSSGLVFVKCADHIDSYCACSLTLAATYPSLHARLCKYTFASLPAHINSVAHCRTWRLDALNANRLLRMVLLYQVYVLAVI